MGSCQLQHLGRCGQVLRVAQPSKQMPLNLYLVGLWTEQTCFSRFCSLLLIELRNLWNYSCSPSQGAARAMQLVCTQLKRENWQGLARLVCLAWTAVEQKPSLAAELAEADAAGVMLGEQQQAPRNMHHATGYTPFRFCVC